MFTIHVHHHHHYEDKLLHSKLDTIMATIVELTAQVDAIQAALDKEQEQVAAAINGLTETIAKLQAIIVDGGTEAERQALADKLAAIKTDLEGTIPDAPAEGEVAPTDPAE